MTTDVKYDFSGKVALVTGAGSGIGRASALAFAAAGASVAVVDIAREAALSTVADIRATGGKAEFYEVNVADENAVIRMVATVVERFGRLDFAHNNAGIEAPHVPMADLESESWAKTMAVNLSAVFYCMKAEINVMLKAGGGAIVNTASASAMIGGYNLSAYTATKHGVLGLTRATAMDYAASNIRINALCPGAIDTPFIGQLPQVIRDRLTFATPAGRLGTPAEMAQATLWLCSSGASYVYGHGLCVDGGVVLGGTGTRVDDLLL